MTLTRTVLSLLAGSVLAVACLGVAEAPPATATAPATKAAVSSDDLKAWVAQLGADDFKTRDAATRNLRAAGPAALPALRDGLKSEDPEVKGRCEKLIARIENGDQPVATVTPAQDPNQDPNVRVGGMGGAGIRIVGGGGGMIVVQGGGQIIVRQQVAVAAGPNGKEVNVNEDGKKIHITENADGIKVSVTEEVDGKDKTTDYAAKDAKELEEKQPEGFKFYKQYMGKGDAVQIQKAFIVAPGGVQVAPEQKP